MIGDPPLGAAIAGRGRFLRPSGVRGGTFRGQNISIVIHGLRDAERIPGELRSTYDAMMIRLQHELQVACRAVVPGGEAGTLGRQTHARRVGRNNIVVGTVGSKFAKALNRGFTSKPKRAKALRFEVDGQVVYTRRVRVAGRHFFEKWLALTGPIVEATYTSSFYNIRDLM